MKMFPSLVINEAFAIRKVKSRYGASYFSGENLLSQYFNAALLLRNDISQQEANLVFEELAREYASPYFLEPSLLDELTQDEIAVLVKRVLTNKYRLLFSKPFRKETNITVEQFWEVSSKWLDTGDGVVIWGANDRWLTIYKMSKQQAFFLGGAGTNIINRNEFSSCIDHSPHRYLKTVCFVRRFEAAGL